MSDSTHNCRRCKHLVLQTESWEMPDVSWYECTARPSMANLLSFPFQNTTCQSFETQPKNAMSLSQAMGCAAEELNFTGKFKKMMEKLS